jgi:hypothetical protein
MMILNIIIALSDMGQRAVVRLPGRGRMARVERRVPCAGKRCSASRHRSQRTASRAYVQHNSLCRVIIPSSAPNFAAFDQVVSHNDSISPFLAL